MIVVDNVDDASHKTFFFHGNEKVSKSICILRLTCNLYCVTQEIPTNYIRYLTTYICNMYLLTWNLTEISSLEKYWEYFEQYQGEWHYNFGNYCSQLRLSFYHCNQKRAKGWWWKIDLSVQFLHFWNFEVVSTKNTISHERRKTWWIQKNDCSKVLIFVCRIKSI